MIHRYNLPRPGKTLKLLTEQYVVYFTNTEFDDSGRLIGQHSHADTTEISFIYQGHGKHIIDGKVFESQEGDIVIYNQGVMHHDMAQPGENMRAFLLSIYNLQMQGREPGYVTYDNRQCVFPTDHYAGFLQRGFEAIEDAMVAKTPAVSMMTQGFLISLLAIVDDIISNSEDSIPHLNGMTLPEQIKLYIDRNFAAPFTLEELADEFHVSRYYTSHVFKKTFGESPMRYRTKLRMGEAQSLLANSDNNITHIANAIGYDDPNRFSQVFAKEFGISPTLYRRRALEQG